MQSEAAKSWRSPTIDPSLGHQRVLNANVRDRGVLGAVQASIWLL